MQQSGSEAVLAISPTSQIQTVVTSASSHPVPETAALEIRQAMGDQPLSQVVFFCSNDYDLKRLASALTRQFEGIDVVGCTTAGEISPDGYSTGGITVIGFSESYFTVEAALVTDLANFSFQDAQALVHSMLDNCHDQHVAPVKGHTFALTLLDGLSVQEERFLQLLNAHLGSIPLLGGSAADNMYHRKTHVYQNGKFHTDAAILLMVNTACDFEAFSIHHLIETEEKLVVTEADAAERRVIELNAEPAAVEYARALDLPIEALTAEVFALNPLTVKLGDQFYPRAIQKVNDDLSLSFYCAIDTGIVLTRSQPERILEGLNELFDGISCRIGTPQLVLGYDCTFRRLEIAHHGLCQQASEILKRHNVIGFNTYGEQFNGMHLNQTFTGVALGGVGF
ncbi:MAG: GfdT protein [Oceanospirillaceae bacterium]|nr:GfdT protein [Oceanospirillaceae bacterium]